MRGPVIIIILKVIDYRAHEKYEIFLFHSFWLLVYKWSVKYLFCSSFKSICIYLHIT